MKTEEDDDDDDDDDDEDDGSEEGHRHRSPRFVRSFRSVGPLPPGLSPRRTSDRVLPSSE